MCVPRINADHGKINALKLMPKPARHCPSLKPDALGVGGPLSQQFAQGAWVGLHPSFVNYPSRLIDNANSGLSL
jgi:hypothetical protein